MEDGFSLDKHKYDERLLKLTFQQIEKDFAQSGFEFKLNELVEISFDKIAQVLVPCIAELLNKNYQAFLNLLYRIDLNESKIKSEVTAHKEMQFELILAEMIIKRELQKVVIKEFYKNKL